MSHHARIRYTGQPPPKCIRCGVLVQRGSRSVAEWRKAKFCSADCQHKHKRESGRGVV